MTTPHPPQGPQGPWQGQAGQPPTPPHSPGQQYGPPPGYPVSGHPYGPPPGQYPGWPPAGPPKKPNAMKWVFAGVGLLAVIAVAVAVTVVVLRSDSEGGGPGSKSDIASADDTGPVGIITSEPTCDKFMPINNALAAEEKKGWSKRDPSLSASDWSAEQRNQYDAIANALRNTADQYVELAKQTPHRVIRELYEQSISYGRAYADSIPHYVAHDDQLVRTFIGASDTIVGVCDAITHGSAGARSVLAAHPGPESPPTAPVKNLTDPTQFITKPDQICPNWITSVEQYDTEIADWVSLDARIPATKWSPEQKIINDTASQTILADAENAQRLSNRTSNPVIKDFLTLTSVYKRVFSKALSTYVAADGYLINAGSAAAGTVYQGCLAAGG